MKDIALITILSDPNSAFANRLKCISKGLMENDVNVSVLAVVSNIRSKESFERDSINFRLLSKTNNKLTKYISGVFNLIFCIRKYDCLFIFLTEPFFIKIVLLFRRKKSVIFHERTEYPELSLKGKRLNYYLNMCQLFNHIFVITSSLQDYFIGKRIDKKKISIFPMLINPKRFEKSEQINMYHFPYMAYCGDMGSNKDGLLDLIDAFNIYTKKEKEYKLILIGDTKDTMAYSKIKNSVKLLELENRIIFTGRVEAEDVPSLLKNAKVLLLDRPDNIQAKYGFPTKLGEYLATSNPVIVTDTGDISKYLTDEEDCFIVKPNEPDSFAKKMLYVVNNYDKACSIAIKGNKKVYSDFNYIVQTKELLKKIY
jgi:glycosyltransferase involved in cell wall biosynthesis